MEEPVHVELPGDRLYEEDCYVQMFGLSDARLLFTIHQTKDRTQLYDLIGRRINLDVKKLTQQDLWYLLHWERVNSYPTFPMRIPWKCPHCGHKNRSALSQSGLVINDLDPEYEHGRRIELSDGVHALRLPLVGDEAESLNFLKRSLDIPRPNQDQIMDAMTACMLEPDGGSMQERYSLVQTFTAEDAFAIQGFEQMFDYGVRPVSDFTCEECKEASTVKYHFTLTSFFPSSNDRADLRDRVLPRETSKSTDRESRTDGPRESSVPQRPSFARAEGALEEETADTSEDPTSVKVAEDIIGE